MVRAITSAVLLTACLAVTGCGGSGPGDAAVAFTEAAAKGEVEAAKKYIAPSDLAGEKGQIITMVLPKIAAQAQEKGGLKSVKVNKETINGDNATINITTTFGNGTSETEDAQMKKIDGKWYIAPGD